MTDPSAVKVKVDYPPCVCGHAAVEHHYSPSGCGTEHCEFGADPDTGAPGCPTKCREYEPDDMEAWERAYEINAKGATR